MTQTTTTGWGRFDRAILTIVLLIVVTIQFTLVAETLGDVPAEDAKVIGVGYSILVAILCYLFARQLLAVAEIVARYVAPKRYTDAIVFGISLVAGSAVAGMFIWDTLASTNELVVRSRLFYLALGMFIVADGVPDRWSKQVIGRLWQESDES